MRKGKRSRTNPGLGDASPGEESQALGNDLETAQSSANMLRGCHCLLLLQWIFPNPRTKAQLTHVTFSHQQEMHGLNSGLPNSMVSSKMNCSPRLLPSGSFISHGQNRFEVNYQGVYSTQALLTLSWHLTLASMRTCSAYLTCLPFVFFPELPTPSK